MNQSLYQNPPDMILYPDRKKLVRLVIVSALVLLLGVATWTMGNIFRFLALIYVPLFGYMLVHTVNWLINPKPVFSVDSRGVTDTSTMTSCGFLPWEEIDYAEIANFNTGQFIVIFLHDNAAFLARQPLIKRSAMKTNINLTGTPVAILTITSLSLEEMLAPIQARLMARGNSEEVR